MKLSLRFAIHASLIAAVGLSAGTASAYATFFGEDLNNSASVPLAATPKSDAAQSVFLSGLANPGVETFEQLTPGTYSSLPLTFPGAGNTKLTATLVGTAGSIIKVEPTKTDGFGRYSVPSATTSQFWQVIAGTSGGFTVSFDQPIAAFGFYGVDVSDFGGQLSIELFNSAGAIGTLAVPNTIGSNGNIDGSVLFFGFTAKSDGERFTSVRFSSTAGQGDAFAFDNFTIADLRQVQPVPEPGSLALVALGLLAFAAAGRRRRDR